MTGKAGPPGALFDLDGLLIDSEVLWSEADAEFLASRGVPLRGGYKDELMGSTLAESGRRMRELFGLRESPEAIAAERLARVERLYAERLEPRPGAAGALDRFRRAGWRLALATASGRSLARLALDRMSWSGAFDALATGDEVSRGKPAPDLFLLAARRIGVPPGRCLVVEDAPAGIEGARAAGMASVAVPDRRFHPESRFDADLVLESLDGLDPAEAGRLLREGPQASPEP